MMEFNNKSRPKKTNVKNKRSAFDSVNVVNEGQKLTKRKTRKRIENINS